MSVVLGASSDFDTIAATVRSLRRQSIAAELELVVVAADPGSVAGPEERYRGFWGHQVVPLDAPFTAPRAIGAGIRAARAPVVALAEDHCFPEPDWAAALVGRHRGGDVSAVGPVFRNANPGTLISWCDFVIGYGPWIVPGPTGDQPFLAGHNSSYRRSVLLELGPRLDELLGAETVLHQELRRRGHRLVVEPAARAAHTNFARLRSWMPVQYLSGRVFASERARGWSSARRVLYAVASPLIPLLRFVRAARHLRRSAGPRPSLLRVGPLLGLGLAADGMGQLVGYLAGSGSSSTRLARFEFRRIDHVPESDRELWAEPEGVSATRTDA